MVTPFGCVILVFEGDFCQIMPIVPRGTMGQIVGACMHMSFIWARARILKLKIYMLQPMIGVFLLGYWGWESAQLSKMTASPCIAMMYTNNTFF